MKRKLLLRRRLPNKTTAYIRESPTEEKSWEEPSGGFSLVELMVSLAVSAVITGILFTFCVEVQKISTEIVSSLESRDSLRLSPVILSRWIKGAGMNMKGDPAEYLEIENDRIGIKSDIKGCDGNPDGDTDDGFEDISIKVIRNELKVKGGKGTYQPFLKNVTSLVVEREGRGTVRLLIAGTEGKLDPGGSVTAETVFRLWNSQPNLFPEELP